MDRGIRVQGTSLRARIDASINGVMIMSYDTCAEPGTAEFDRRMEVAREAIRRSIRRSYTDYRRHQMHVIPGAYRHAGAIRAAVAHVRREHPFTEASTINEVLKELLS